MTVYVFVFEGEFGFELLNWQGVVRKFAQTTAPHDKIVCCSRANLYPLYESADEFVDISDVPLFKRSRASAYWGIFTPAELPRYRLLAQLREKTLKRQLRAQLRRYIKAHSTVLQANPDQPVRFVFSSRRTRLNGCVFGWSRRDGVMDIYDLLDVGNNLYRPIEPDAAVRPKVEAQLGWSLDEPYLLVQMRHRDPTTDQPSDDTMDDDRLIDMLSERMRVVLLSFDTGRWLDSHSTFGDRATYVCRTFPEQATLVAYARHSLFFTEGDFGSHIYVPPFMGRDVSAVAPRSIYQLESTPIAFWNENVFCFGGHILPVIAEEIFTSDETLEEFTRSIEQRVWVNANP